MVDAPDFPRASRIAEISILDESGSGVAMVSDDLSDSLYSWRVSGHEVRWRKLAADVTALSVSLRGGFAAYSVADQGLFVYRRGQEDCSCLDPTIDAGRIVTMGVSAEGRELGVLLSDGSAMFFDIQRLRSNGSEAWPQLFQGRVESVQFTSDLSFIVSFSRRYTDDGVGNLYCHVYARGLPEAVREFNLGNTRHFDSVVAAARIWLVEKYSMILHWDAPSHSEVIIQVDPEGAERQVMSPEYLVESWIYDSPEIFELAKADVVRPAFQTLAAVEQNNRVAAVVRQSGRRTWIIVLGDSLMTVVDYLIVEHPGLLLDAFDLQGGLAILAYSDNQIQVIRKGK